jgi:threonine/homoserine efflux transporter RhtA
MSYNSMPVEAIIALLCGLLILIQPRLLNYVVAIYLIVIGVVGIAPHFIPGLR